MFENTLLEEEQLEELSEIYDKVFSNLYNQLFAVYKLDSSYIAVCVPTIKELISNNYFSKTLEKEIRNLNVNYTIVVISIYELIDNWINYNFNYLNILHTPYFKINPNYNLIHKWYITNKNILIDNLMLYITNDGKNNLPQFDQLKDDLITFESKLINTLEELL